MNIVNENLFLLIIFEQTNILISKIQLTITLNVFSLLVALKNSVINTQYIDINKVLVFKFSILLFLDFNPLFKMKNNNKIANRIKNISRNHTN